MSAIIKEGWKGDKDLDGDIVYPVFHFMMLMYWLFGDINNIQGKFRILAIKFNRFEDSGLVSFDFVDAGIDAELFHSSMGFEPEAQ